MSPSFLAWLLVSTMTNTHADRARATAPYTFAETLERWRTAITAEGKLFERLTDAERVALRAEVFEP